ncbi:orotidine-5'-phosphate decarboxylase [Candidatus Gottesmanbacteria bacterium]|nr:orotidine-5'-phosphate decarboxylase [Candidatus Gottesmanbacteria bacterium]
MTFYQKLNAIVQKQNSLVCVGLDSDIQKIPKHIRVGEHPQTTFNKTIIDATHDLVCAYKPNAAFYEARGKAGIEALKMTCDYLREKYPEIVLILDAKRADIGSTNEGYVQFAFDYLGADAITLHPYLGKDAILPFLERKEKGSFILCRTSNPGAGELQDLTVVRSQSSEAGALEGKSLYQIVAQNVVKDWNYNANCGLVVGATYPSELEIVRRIVGDMPILIPGIGAQGGDVEKTVKAGVDSQGKNAIINASRSIIFASNGEDFAQIARKEAMKLRDEINKYR